jgi:hypothetical protein
MAENHDNLLPAEMPSKSVVTLRVTLDVPLPTDQLPSASSLAT